MHHKREREMNYIKVACHIIKRVTVCYYCNTRRTGRNSECIFCVVMCEVLTLAEAVCLQARAHECSGGNEAKQEVLKPPLDKYNDRLK